jgi:protease-4
MDYREERNHRRSGGIGGFLKKIVLWVVMMVAGILVSTLFLAFAVSGVITLLGEEGQEVKNGSVAVIEVTDAISDGSKILKALYESAYNPKVAGIVVRVDSPGGSVGPSQELHDAIRRLRVKKKIVVSMGSVAASGGLYLALSADKIFCQPGTLTGSIGVIMQTPNVASIADKVGFKMMTIKSGKLKDVGNPFRPMEAADQEFLSTVINTTYDQFVNAVWEGREKAFAERGTTREKMLEFADGRIIPGSTAKEVGLVDEFGDVYDAARAVLAMSGKPIPDDQLPTLTHPGRKLMRFRELFEAAGSATSAIKKMMISGSTEILYQAPIS